MSGIQDLLAQLPIGKPKEESALTHNVILVMDRFHRSAEEMDKMALPTFVNLLDFLREEAKTQEKEMNKSKRKR